MDLVYMDMLKQDLGCLGDYTLDMAFGKDENNFECCINQSGHCCEAGFFLYIENTEYGGIIDDLNVITQDETIKYIGRTWHGILNSKIIEPDFGEDYLILSGDANSVLRELVERLSLSCMFKVSMESSGIEILNYKMNRYIKGFDGIRKMLKAFGAKPKIIFKDGFANISAVPIVDYSKDEEFDADQIQFDVLKKYHTLNHVICLGKGELKDRMVLHLYTDSTGNIVDEQRLFGLDEVSDIYENTGAESEEELRQGGIEMLQESWNSDEIKYNLDAENQSYDIGDIVGAQERITKVGASGEIVKKIVAVKNNQTTISYEVG